MTKAEGVFCQRYDAAAAAKQSVAITETVAVFIFHVGSTLFFMSYEPQWGSSLWDFSAAITLLLEIGTFRDTGAGARAHPDRGGISSSGPVWYSLQRLIYGAQPKLYCFIKCEWTQLSISSTWIKKYKDESLQDIGIQLKIVTDCQLKFYVQHKYKLLKQLQLKLICSQIIRF